MAHKCARRNIPFRIFPNILTRQSHYPIIFNSSRIKTRYNQSLVKTHRSSLPSSRLKSLDDTFHRSTNQSHRDIIVSSRHRFPRRWSLLPSAKTTREPRIYVYERERQGIAENATDQRHLRAVCKKRRGREGRRRRDVCPAYILLSANVTLFTAVHRHYGNLPRIRNAAPC